MGDISECSKKKNILVLRNLQLTIPPTHIRNENMNETDHLIELYKQYTGTIPEIVASIPGSGSNRFYVRLGFTGNTVIGAFNRDLKENAAFLSFTNSFSRQGLPVPQVLSVSKDGLCYLLHDLGDQTLFGLLSEKRGNNPAFPEEARTLYQQVIGWLPRFQTEARPDYAFCYPRAAFDRQSMLWDLNYFKYYYLKLAGVQFDEQQLEDDFHAFSSFLLEAPNDFFMYRDFQSRNVMIHNGQPWFIDYQGGRRGPLQYDLVSLLYDAKANLPENIRHDLRDRYLEKQAEHHPVDKAQFLKYYPGFVLIRILQAMGAYGFRGYYEKKSHFLQSIPYALKNIETIINEPFLCSLPEISRVLARMIGNPHPAGKNSNLPDALNGKAAEQPSAGNNAPSALKVSIVSFSYKKGYPVDPSGNGGGFVFDCRALPNPGRFEQYKQLTGMDNPVIEFLKKEDSVSRFLDGVYGLVDQSVDEYQRRNFTHLMVSFGCTGGQHRSVYCAQALANHLEGRKSGTIHLQHREQD